MDTALIANTLELCSTACVIGFPPIISKGGPERQTSNGGNTNTLINVENGDNTKLVK